MVRGQIKAYFDWSPLDVQQATPFSHGSPLKSLTFTVG